MQMDVSNAFLNGNINKEVFMEFPHDNSTQAAYNSSPAVCKLITHQQWVHKMATSLLTFGFAQSKSDRSLFTHTENETFTAVKVVLIYVDDLLITDSSPMLIFDEEVPEFPFH